MLQVLGLTVAAGDTVVVRDADLTVESSGVTALMGPSGSGKTTLLRAVAGLQQPTAGRILWNGEPVGHLRPDERPFGLMFQDFALFPHRTVGENVGFGLKMAGVSRSEIAARVAELLDLVGLPDFTDRSVTRLSGGEQQRVALARALAPEPGLLMLDEPLGSLDRSLRDRLLREMRDIFASLEPSVLYVTHDQQEAFEVAERVAVMDEGRIVRTGTPEDLWRDPGTEFVARFLGFDDIFEAKFSADAADLGWVALPITQTGNKVVLLPGAVSLVSGDTAPTGPIGTGTVVDSRYTGGRHEVLIAVGPAGIVHSESADRPARGSQVQFAVNPHLVAVVD